MVGTIHNVHLNLPDFGHVLALQASSHKRRAEPSDTTESGGERDPAQSERRNERITITGEGM